MVDMRAKLFLTSLVVMLVSVVPAHACELPSDHPSLLFGRIVASWHETSKHPLVGQLYNPSKTQPDAETAQHKADCKLADDYWIMAGKPDFLLLGEIHDNPEHHRIRTSLFQLGAVVSEHISSDRAPDVERFKEMAKKTERTLTLDDFKAWTSWAATGWTDDVARMLADVAIQGKVPVYAGDVPRAQIRRVSMEGGGALPLEDMQRLALDVPLGEALDEASLTEIEESHCNLMPREALHGMAFAQRYRDASLADALVKAAGKHGSAVLVAGNGHVRTDRGAAWYLRKRLPEKKIVSVTLVEVEDGKTDPDSYVPRDPDGKPATDFILFTPKAGRPDPCEEMRERMKK